jgi:thiol-disulfide isomerase/thioredoxin
MNRLTRKSLTALAMMAFIASCAQPPAEKEIKFVQKTWDEVKALAKKENKMIFMDAYTDWCGPCKMMAAKVFTDSTVAQFYNKNFINTKFDMEKGEGIEIKKKYDVRFFPTYLFISADGELIHRAVGYMPPPPFIEKGKDAMDPNKQLIGFQKKYEAGNREPQFMMSYLKVLQNGGANADLVKDEYFKTQKESDLSSEDNWNLLNEFESNPESPAFKYLLSHQEEFSGKYSADKVGAKIYAVLLGGAMKNIYRDTTGKAFDNVNKQYQGISFGRKDELMLEIATNYYQKIKDWKKFASTADQLVAKYKSKDAEFMNNISWTAYESFEDKAMLEKALGWAKRSVEINKKSYNTDTYASLLFKLGKKAEAIEQEELAIKLAKEEGTPYDDLEKTLESFKK